MQPLEPHWNEIKSVFQSSLRSSKYCAIASIDQSGQPHITPIGFIFLQDNFTCFYFEEYSRALPMNYETNNNVCLMAVNRGFLFWAKALLKGRFELAPGIRLYGKAGSLRRATESEISKYKSMVKSSRRLKGNKLIWSNLQTVREIKLESFKPIEYPKMTDHLWKNP